MMADVVLQRKNMVESQVRPSDITDRRIIRAMLEIPREAYVPAGSEAIAYGDLDIKLGAGTKSGPARVLMMPRIFAKLVQLCAIEPHDDVLIVGAGMGYSAAIVAQLAKSVTALEEDETLAAHATKTLADQGITQADVVTGPMADGLPAKAPFDVIIVEGAAAVVPQALLDQLGPNGRLAVISAAGPAGKATLWRRHTSGFDATEAFDASGIILPGFAKAPAFTF
jgi:protein-L-isoaspartate(D-aspartate) O-methyltransferase